MTAIIAKSCRICLEGNDKKLRPLYRKTNEELSEEETPIIMLKNLMGKSAINIENEIMIENLPKYICRACELNLNLAHEFRIKVLETQDIIEQYCAKLNSSNFDELSGIEKTYYDTQEDQCPVYKTEELEEDNLLQQEEVPFEMVDKTEIYIENEQQEEYLEPIEFNESKIIEQEESDESEEDDERENDETDRIALESLKKLSEGKKHYTKRKKSRSFVEQATTEDTTQAPRSANNKYICDICGNVYFKRGRLTEHRKRHSESCYECELCGKPFNLREPFRRHMLLHTSAGRPLKCSQCSRTFFYESVLRRHEAIHAGAKPYVCDVCDRAFAYDQALKKHKLIHSNIKLYHCDLCNKDFRLHHHLQRHEESRVHLNALQAFKNSRN